MPIIIAPESINELTLICVLIQSRLMRSGMKQKVLAFVCVVNNKTFKMEAVPINQFYVAW